MYYVVIAASAAFFAYVAPFVWKHISINILGPYVQNALIAGAGAVLGALLAERLGLKGRGRR